MSKWFSRWLKPPEPARTKDDIIIRAEIEESLEMTRQQRTQIQRQWPQVIDMTNITQPRLEQNGFTDAIADLVITPWRNDDS